MAYYERLIRDKPRRRDRDLANIYFVIARQFVRPLNQNSFDPDSDSLSTEHLGRNQVFAGHVQQKPA